MLNCSSGSGQDLSALASLPSLIGRLAVCLRGCLPVRRLHKSNQINTFINSLANRKMPSLFQAIWTHGSKGNLSCPTRVILVPPLPLSFALSSFGGDRLSIKMLFSISNLSFGQHSTTQHGNSNCNRARAICRPTATGCLRCTILATDPESELGNPGIMCDDYLVGA